MSATYELDEAAITQSAQETYDRMIDREAVSGAARFGDGPTAVRAASRLSEPEVCRSSGPSPAVSMFAADMLKKAPSRSRLVPEASKHARSSIPHVMDVVEDFDGGEESVAIAPSQARRSSSGAASGRPSLAELPRLASAGGAELSESVALWRRPGSSKSIARISNDGRPPLPLLSSTSNRNHLSSLDTHQNGDLVVLDESDDGFLEFTAPTRLGNAFVPQPPAALTSLKTPQVSHVLSGVTDPDPGLFAADIDTADLL